MTQLVDLVIDGGVLFDVSVRLRNICLRLIVIIIADEVPDIIIRKERLELTRELRSKRLVVRDDERRPLHALDDLCHRIGLARARRAEQHLCGHPVLDAACKIGDCLRLIAHRFKGSSDFERKLRIEPRCIEFWNHRHRPLSSDLLKSHSCIITHSAYDGNSMRKEAPRRVLRTTASQSLLTSVAVMISTTVRSLTVLRSMKPPSASWTTGIAVTRDSSM